MPGKNIKALNGLPLIAWTILAARRADCFDQIWVSTDSEEIGQVAESFGARFFCFSLLKLTKTILIIFFVQCLTLTHLIALVY